MQNNNKLGNLLRTAIMVLALVTTPLTALAAAVVDINRADAATMIENWKGIGEKKASAIVSYRNSNGPFSSVDDLKNVTGIGDTLIKNNRKLMSVTKGASKATGKTQSSTKKSNSKEAKTSSKDKKTSSSAKKSDTDSSSSVAKKSTSKKSTDKSDSKKSKSKTKKSTSKKSTSKKSSSKKSDSKSSKKKKKKKCKKGSKDKNCK